MSNHYPIDDDTQPRPANTPNAVVESPKVRKGINIGLFIVGVVLGTTITVDLASEEMNLLPLTIPASAAYSYLTSIFGLVVTVPNIPKRR